MKQIVLSLCAAGTAVAVAGFLYLSGDKPAQGGALPGPAVMLVGVHGAPGNGNTALALALATILTNAKIPIANELDACTVAVSAEVSTLKQGEAEVVSIIWQVHDANGEQVGEVEQTNRIAAGALDGAWGTEASLAARGGKDGIVKLLKRMPESCA